MLRQTIRIRNAALAFRAKQPQLPPIRNASTESKPPTKPLPVTPSTLLLYTAAALLGGHIFFSYFYEYNGCHGVSMLPTFNSFGDAVLISKYYRRGRGVQVGDIVSYAHPIKSEERAIKRVLGMPGDFVVRDTPGAEMEGRMIQVPEGHCWIVGDNLQYSRDSRMFGPIPLALIKGKVIRRFTPWYRPHKLGGGFIEVSDGEGVD